MKDGIGIVTGTGVTGQGKYIELTHGGTNIAIPLLSKEEQDQMVIMNKDDVFIFDKGEWKNEKTGAAMKAGTHVAGQAGVYRLDVKDNIGSVVLIGRLIGRSLGNESVRTVRCPPAAVWTISTFYEVKMRLTGKTQPFDWDKAKEALHHWTCSPEKAHSQLNFSPKPLEERIAQTTQWFTESGWL